MQALIDGQWLDPLGSTTLELRDPNTGLARGVTVDCSEEQVKRALAAARSASWNATLDERFQLLLAAAAAIDSIAAEMAVIDAVETGVPLFITKQIEGGLRPAATAFLQSAYSFLSKERSLEIPGRYGHPIMCYREAVSPAVIVAPWNVPSGTIIPKLFVALLCGCSVIVKPSEHASGGIALMVRTIAAGIPGGVLQLLLGGPAVGQQLVSSALIGCVQFTGAAPTASKIAVACAASLRPFLAECGGSNTAILLNDADLDIAVPAVAMGLTTLNGQWCMGISRILVHNSIRVPFIQRLVSYCNDRILVTRSVPMVEPPQGDESILIGPMAFAEHAALLRTYIGQSGGTAIPLGAMSASIAAQEAFVQPTLILEPNHDVIAKLELFGPVAAVCGFECVDEAVALSNAATGQLAAYVFSEDVGGLYRLAARITTGMVMLNSVNFCFEPADGFSEPMGDFVGTAGHGSDGNGEALARFFSSRRWCGINGPQKKTPEADNKRTVE
jgi:acyl-CoA reductase-like NAD-dependent aldehyde dehydrogenase